MVADTVSIQRKLELKLDWIRKEMLDLTIENERPTGQCGDCEEQSSVSSVLALETLLDFA